MAVHGLPTAARHRLGAIMPARRDAVAGLLGFAAIAPIAFFDGGYFPTAWGIPALVGLWVATITIIVAPASLHRREAVALLALAALLGWAALSLLWSSNRSQTVLEIERLTIYLAALAALLLVARKESVPWLLGGAAAAIVVTCGTALTERLFQDAFGRPEPRIEDAGALYGPVGYSNALGNLAAVGVILLVGFIVHARRPAARAITAGMCMILVAALALSLSRGAWLGLGVGVAAAVTLAPGRSRVVGWLLALAVPGVAVVALSLRADALVRRGAAAGTAVEEGHRLALAIGTISIGAAALAALGPRLLPKDGASIPVRRLALSLGLVIALLLVALTIRAGGPSGLAERGGDAFSKPSHGAEPTQRFFSASVSRREQFWSIAWQDFEAHPLAGSGSGSFGRYWLEHRPVGRFVQDAHSLYLETLAELGLVGLALLAVALAVPVASAVTARGHPLVATTLGAFTVYIVQASVDWLWEMPVTTMAAIVCGAGLLLAGRPTVSNPIPRPARAGAVGLALALGTLSFIGLIGNHAASAAEQALSVRDLERAETQARRATTWLPWAPDPWLLLARTQLARGEQVAARQSLDRALQLDPGNWLLWYERGLSETGSERRRYFAGAARLNPRDMRRLARSG
ncbi:MAG: O-antigen ligase family protein [Gaiellaceae bacterium]